MLDQTMFRIWCVLLLGGWLAWLGGADGPGAVLGIDFGMTDSGECSAVFTPVCGHESVCREAGSAVHSLHHLRVPCGMLHVGPHGCDTLTRAHELSHRWAVHYGGNLKMCPYLMSKIAMCAQ